MLLSGSRRYSAELLYEDTVLALLEASTGTVERLEVSLAGFELLSSILSHYASGSGGGGVGAKAEAGYSAALEVRRENFRELLTRS